MDRLVFLCKAFETPSNLIRIPFRLPLHHNPRKVPRRRPVPPLAPVHDGRRVLRQRVNRRNVGVRRRVGELVQTGAAVEQQHVVGRDVKVVVRGVRLVPLGRLQRPFDVGAVEAVDERARLGVVPRDELHALRAGVHVVDVEGRKVVHMRKASFVLASEPGRVDCARRPLVAHPVAEPAEVGEVERIDGDVGVAAGGALGQRQERRADPWRRVRDAQRYGRPKMRAHGRRRVRIAPVERRQRQMPRHLARRERDGWRPLRPLNSVGVHTEDEVQDKREEPLARGAEGE